MNTALSKTPVILLAAGNSSRMGQPKGLAPFQGRTWLESQLSKMGAVGLKECVIVLGTHSDLYLQALETLKNNLTLELSTIVNSNPELGQFSSIQVGGRCALNLYENQDFFWILPIDVPCPKKEVWDKIAKSSAAASVPIHEGHGGHPVKLSREFLLKLISLSPADPASRLDHQLHSLGPLVDRIEVGDPEILKNLNSPEDLQREQK